LAPAIKKGNKIGGPPEWISRPGSKKMGKSAGSVTIANSHDKKGKGNRSCVNRIAGRCDWFEGVATLSVDKEGKTWLSMGTSHRGRGEKQAQNGYVRTGWVVKNTTGEIRRNTYTKGENIIAASEILLRNFKKDLIKTFKKQKKGHRILMSLVKERAKTNFISRKKAREERTNEGRGTGKRYNRPLIGTRSDERVKLSGLFRGGQPAK